MLKLPFTMKRILHHTLFLILSILPVYSWSQTTIRGIVLDSTTHDPLIGVTILEADTERGTISDLDGRFVITVARSDARLIIRYTGYRTVELDLAGRTDVEVIMAEEVMIFEQLVVVGYGIQKKRDLTGSVSSIKGKDISRVATSNIEQALQGKISGVYVSPSSGAPGAGAVIRIRGTGTLNNANPLYVIDGMITYDASIVNPEDVESVEVLKDASAAAIYGSRGANGVIIITTKSGVPRETAIIKGTAYYGVQEITQKIDLLNGAEFAAAYNDLRGQPYYPDPTLFGEGTDWQDEIFETAQVYNATIGANGGSQQFSYNFNANYFSHDGIIPNSHFDRLILRLNAEYKLSPSIKLGHNFAHFNVRTQNPPGVVGSAYRMPPVFAPRDSTGDFSDPTFFGLAIANPAADLFYKSNNRDTGNRLFGNLYLDVELLKHFTFRTNLGIDNIHRLNRGFEPKFQVSPSQLNKNDRLTVRAGDANEWIWEQTLTYDQTWTDHHVTFLAGYTAEERRYDELGGSRENFPGTAEELLYLSAGNDTTQMNFNSSVDEALNSNIFRLNYGFKDRYLLTLTLRLDRSSRFTAANRRGNFPSASVGWNVGSEKFMSRYAWVDRLKLRASYGVLGNQSSSSPYPSAGAVASGLYGVFGPSESLNQGATLTSLSNANLQWETSRQADIGIDAGFFKGQLELEVDWYKRHTYDIIADVPIPDYVGSQNDPVVNTAEVDNQGWDFLATYRSAGEFSYNIGLILSPVTNKVIKLAEGRSEIFAAFLNGEPATHTVVGLPIGSFYGYKVAGIFQTQEEINASPNFGVELPGDIRYEDTNRDGVLNGEDRVYLGSPIPKITYSLTAGFEWKGVDFNADLVGVAGHKVFNAKELLRFDTPNWEHHVVDRWTADNPSQTEPRITNGGHNFKVSDRFLADGDYLTLRNITLGYTLPRKWLEKVSMTKFRVYVTGANVWVKQDYKGYFPEFPNGSNSYQVGFDFGGYPLSRSWQGGLEIQF